MMKHGKYINQPNNMTQEQFNELRKKGLSVEQIIKFEGGSYKPPKQTGKLSDIALGIGSGIVSTGIGLGKLATKGAEKLASLQPTYGSQKLKDIKESQVSYLKRIGDVQGELQEGFKEQGQKTKLGTAGFMGEQVAEYLLPQTKITKGANLLTRGTQLGSRALGSASIASAQEGKIGKETAIAGGTELLLPGVGKVLKPVTNVIGRLFNGLGAGLSGVGSEAIETIYKNPKRAIEVSQRIIKEGQESILEGNAKTILEGVSKIRQEARNAYGKGLEALSKTDIKPKQIFDNTVDILKKKGITFTKTGINMSDSEIFNPTIQKRAKELITELNGLVNTDGKRLKTFLDKLDAKKFLKSTDPDRLAFNSLVKDLSNGIKKAIGESTNKLNTINKKFSTDMSLVEAMEGIFGKVNFKNTKELNRVAKGLENLFSQKGLDPKTVTNFLNRIGIDDQAFRTSEAVRDIVTKKTGVNTKGVSFAEFTQQLTSSVITPKTVKNIAIITGLAENTIKNIIEKTAPTARASIIKMLIESNK